MGSKTVQNRLIGAKRRYRSVRVAADVMSQGTQSEPMSEVWERFIIPTELSRLERLPVTEGVASSPRQRASMPRRGQSLFSPSRAATL
jgi:hypothetical protein